MWGCGGVGGCTGTASPKTSVLHVPEIHGLAAVVTVASRALHICTRTTQGTRGTTQGTRALHTCTRSSFAVEGAPAAGAREGGAGTGVHGQRGQGRGTGGAGGLEGNAEYCSTPRAQGQSVDGVRERGQVGGSVH